MSTASTFDLGQSFRVSVAFTNAAGTATDPTAVKFRYKTPAGVTSTLAYSASTRIVKSATGSYYCDVASTGSGYYAWRWYSTGNLNTATEGKTYIRTQTV